MSYPLDSLLDNDEIAALNFRRDLVPAEGTDAIIFPPTFAGDGKNDLPVYEINEITGRPACTIDSVGSQANRMESLFRHDPYAELVPQVVIEIGSERVNLLDMGHRIADAAVRFSSLGEDACARLKAHLEGDSMRLAELSPTSLVFGAWDSRGTRAKIPRAVRSTIRAYDVEVLRRNAQYATPRSEATGYPIDYHQVFLGDEKAAERERIGKLAGESKRLSGEGLAPAPSRGQLGGVLVHGPIRHDASLNLARIRAIRSVDKESTRALRRYVLGLALIALTGQRRYDLREGCLLVADPDGKHSGNNLEQVNYSGEREAVSWDNKAILEAAQYAAGVIEKVSGTYSFLLERMPEPKTPKGGAKKAKAK